MPFFEELQTRTAAERQALLAVPAIVDCLAGRVTRARYVAFLREAYHHVKHTVPLLMACGSRLGEDRSTLRAAVTHYIAEEAGHEQWILEDLRARRRRVCRASCAARSGDRAPGRLRLRLHRAGEPGRHARHGARAGRHEQRARHAGGALDRRHARLPPAAFSYLTSHGALDQEHVRFFEDTVNAATSEELEHVVHVAKRVYRLYGDIFRELPA